MEWNMRRKGMHNKSVKGNQLKLCLQLHFMMRKIRFRFIFYTVFKRIPLFAVIHGDDRWRFRSMVSVFRFFRWFPCYDECAFFFGFSRSVIWREIETVYCFWFKLAYLLIALWTWKAKKHLISAKWGLAFFFPW